MGKSCVSESRILCHMTLHNLCVPRESVFDSQRRDTVLDLNDLSTDHIDVQAFFDENFVTAGMRELLELGFRRLEGGSPQGVFLLKQSMGGGKTHNLLTFGLLAKHPEIREKALQGLYQPTNLGAVRVVTFNGRETDFPLGLWGSIAEQLGKREHFKDCYSPLQAPGQKAWENLFANETVLLLLDELPPYFDHAESKAIGNSDLARVTATALSNLFVALGSDACSKVCLVMTDLGTAYARGSNYIREALGNLQNEAHRSAKTLEPVRLNDDELYQILRTRLFASLPDEKEIETVAKEYEVAVRDARQMDITNESPESFALRIRATYPFHPTLRDLYARFRENEGFQQTRALIRLMRGVVAELWNSKRSQHQQLIAAHDIDLNDDLTRLELRMANPTLENAIAHDIASMGSAVAETMDQNLGNNDATDLCKLLLMASLANVPNAVVGLNIPEIVLHLCAPNRDASRLPALLESLSTAAWYLHSNRDGKFYFKNVQNLNAKLFSLVGQYQEEQALKLLRERLETMFKPEKRLVYQRVVALPALNEVELNQSDVTLVIFRPFQGSGLNPDIKAFFDNASFKNRVAFLTGTKETYQPLIEAGKRLRAMKHIIDELKQERVADNDPQMVQALELNDKTIAQFQSVVRETFTVLWYPGSTTENEELVQADFPMKFQGNQYNGENQILETLKARGKYEENVTEDTFRKKCEQRLFTQQQMPWTEIKKRAATNVKWNWHRTDALEALRTDCLQKEMWREHGGILDKGPFPQPKTEVRVQASSRDPKTGETQLRITPIHGDTVYYDFGGVATRSSQRLEGTSLTTAHLEVSFVSVDSSGQHETGEAFTWRNQITLQHRDYVDASGLRRMELQASPNAEIRYTTDGSSPRNSGAIYDSPFVLQEGTTIVLAMASRGGVESAQEKIAVDWGHKDKFKVDAGKPARWKRHEKTQDTKSTYTLFESLKRHKVKASGVVVTVSGGAGRQEYIELNFSKEKELDAETIENCIAPLRTVQNEGVVECSIETLVFNVGADLLEWAEDKKLIPKAGDVNQ